MFKWQQFHPKNKSDKLYQLLLTNDNSSNYQRHWDGTNHQFPDQHPLSTEVPHIYPAIPAGFRRIWHPFHHPWWWFLLCLLPVVPAMNAAASILLDRGTLEKQGGNKNKPINYKAPLHMRLRIYIHNKTLLLVSGIGIKTQVRYLCLM